MKNKNMSKIILFLLPVLVLYFLFFIYPLGFVFFTSLTQWHGLGKMQFIGFENFKNLFSDSVFLLSLKNNIIWAFVLGFIQVPLACVMAMVLCRKPKGWKFFRTIYFLPNVISQVALAMMWLAIYNADHGLLNSLLNVFTGSQITTSWLGSNSTALPAVIIQQLFYIGYFMIVILASRVGIPESYYEAAELDGANVWQEETKITLPMLKPILVTTITLGMAYGMRHFESTFLMTGGGPNHATSVMGILLYTKLEARKYGVGSAIGATLIIFGAVVIALIRRFLNHNQTEF